MDEVAAIFLFFSFHSHFPWRGVNKFYLSAGSHETRRLQNY
jgi:hypothetical protein